MIGIIVTGHGNFATGITSSLKLIAHKPKYYEAIDFVLENSVNDLEKKLNASIDKLRDCKNGILIFTDLIGGVPFKLSVEISQKRKEKIVVLSGTNLGMLIEATLGRRFIKDIDILADMAVNTGKEQIIRYIIKAREE